MSTPEHQRAANALDRMIKHVTTKAKDPRHQKRSDTLTSLGKTLTQAQTEWNKLANDSAKPTDKDKRDYDKYAKALADGLPKLENGIIDAMSAFETGDPYAEAASVLNICSTVISTIGSLLGPEGEAVSTVLGTLVGLIGPILGLFEPKKPSLIAQLDLLIKKEQAKEEIRQLKLALQDMQALEDTWKKNAWTPINLQNGDEVKKMRLASIWLGSTDNQTEGLRQLWFQLLELQCQTFVEVVKSVPHALGALNQYRGTDVDKNNAARLLTIGVQATQRLQLEFLQGITEYIQNHGIFFYVGTGRGRIYVADYCTDYHDRSNPGFRDTGGSVQKISIAIAKAEWRRPDPNIHVFFMHDNDRIGHGHMRWPSGGVDDYGDLPVEEVAGCTDIWATYDPVDPEGQKVAFFTAHGGKELRGYRLGDNNSKGESKILWREPVDKVTSIRAVQFPQPVPGDPDENPENPRVLNDISWIVYGGCRGTSQVWVWASNGKKGFVRTQNSGSDIAYTNIAVDPQYLWVVSGPQSSALMTTHTAVLRALNQPSQPAIPSSIYGVEVTDLSPCGDGTLFMIIRDRVTHKPWRIVDDGIAKYVQSGGWTDLPDTAVSLQKLPNYDWPLVGGLIKVLEVKVREAQSVTPAAVHAA